MVRERFKDSSYWLLPGHFPLDTTTKSRDPSSKHLFSRRLHLLGYVLPSDPQTGSKIQGQPRGQSELAESEIIPDQYGKLIKALTDLIQFVISNH